MNLIEYMAQDVYEKLFKRNEDIVADTIELAIRETLYIPGGTTHKPAMTCTAVSMLYHKKMVTNYAQSVTRKFIMECLAPFSSFELYAYSLPKKYPQFARRPVDGDEMQWARIKWLRELVTLLRTRI